ncbi:MAG: hypothetical protein ABFD07_01405 [Methanobacterium sp.]
MSHIPSIGLSDMLPDNRKQAIPAFLLEEEKALQGLEIGGFEYNNYI